VGISLDCVSGPFFSLSPTFFPSKRRRVFGFNRFLAFEYLVVFYTFFFSFGAMASWHEGRVGVLMGIFSLFS